VSIKQLASVFALIASAVQADALDEMLAQDAMAGRFSQEIVASDGTLLESSAGSFRLMQPDYLWWQIETPDRQLLVTSGDTLTQIDWDLEVRSTHDMADMDKTPLYYLLTSRSDIEAAFDVDVVGAAVLLAPRESTSLYQRILIEKDTAAGWRLRITDRGDQSLEIRLLPEKSIALSPADFVAPDTPF